MKDIVGSFKIYGSRNTIRYKNYDGVWYFVYDDIFDYIKCEHCDESELKESLELRNLSLYTETFKPDKFIRRNEAYLVGDQQEDVICISKFGIKFMLEAGRFFDTNKIHTLIEYLDKNF